MKSKIKYSVLVILGSFVLAVTLQAASCSSCIGGKQRTYSELAQEQPIVWQKKSSLSEEAFLDAVRRDAEYMPQDISESLIRNFPEWHLPLTRQYHVVAKSLQIPHAAMGGYVMFGAGGKEVYVPGRRDKTRVYKIHLMPQDDTLLPFAYLFAKMVQGNPELFSRILEYKFIVDPQGDDGMPRVVVYLDGKENAQAVLDILYTALAGIPGSGLLPRFSAYVTDLLWITQGNGDEKRDPLLQADYEQPEMIYFRSDYTGKNRNYHLKHPGTGKELDTTVGQPISIELSESSESD